MKMYQSNRPLAGLSCIMKDGRWILFATEGNRPLAGLSCINSILSAITATLRNRPLAGLSCISKTPQKKLC